MDENKIIIIEDNETMRLGMADSMRREGFSIAEFENGADALEYYKKNPVDIVISDLKMSPVDGLKVLKGVKKENPKAEVLMVSAFGTVETAVNAIKLGASDFLTKPFSPEELRMRVNKLKENIIQKNKIEQLTETNRTLQNDLSGKYENIISKSTLMNSLFQLIEKVAGEDSGVLVQGESGTGKELIAREIYLKSKRNEKPYIKVNCGALNDNLLESELFGHEKGAFTGAVRQKKGRFELADGGTIFLDEIGDISPVMQVKLLRVLQEQEFARVGGEETIKVDVRVLAATNKDLVNMMSNGKFREDLFYRLNIIPLKVPSLRERKEDISLLTEFFLKKISKRKGESPKIIKKEGMKILQEYLWPGNIRELENFVERLCIISSEHEIKTDLISHHLSGITVSGYSGLDNLPLEAAVESFEKKLVVQAMKKANDVKNKAAKMLGIKTSTLYYKLEKYGLY